MKLLFIDTETGGLNPDENSLLTIALAVYEDGKIVAEKEFAVKHKNYCVNAKALEINNINLIEHDKIAIEKKEVVQEIIKFINYNFEDRAIIAGHNVEFDYKFLNKLFESESEDLGNYLSYRKIDTCILMNFLKAIELIDIKSASLEEAIKYFNIKTNARHTAKDDVKATIEVYQNIVNLIIKIKM